MKIRVRLFAALREATGRAELELEMPSGATPEAVWQSLTGQRPGLAPRRASLTVAINRRYATFDQELDDGDEVVFVPPVSGG